MKLRNGRFSALYRGVLSRFENSTDAFVWLEKFEFVVKLQKHEKPQENLPLILDDGAFAVYQGLSEEKTNNYKEIKLALEK